MNRADGIADTISDCLTEHAIELPADVLQQLAEDIDHGCRMYDECAYAPIPNPLSAEVDRIKEARKADEREHDKEAERLRNNIEEWKRECRRLEWKLDDARREGFRG